jgi:hexosaminidase
VPLAVVPKPVTLEPGNGAFVVRASTAVTVSPSTAQTRRIARMLGLTVGPGPVSLELGKTGLGPEGYELTVTPSAVKLVAEEPAGLFYGVQTIRQLLGVGKRLPAVRIRDRPRFGWRGAMLDVARHFRPVKDVKRYIDLIALYKLNRLHLHLSDDQGWRIAIAKWPRLATHGGQTEVGGGRGGYYTQRQYVDIVNYAAARYVEIVPEIDSGPRPRRHYKNLEVVAIESRPRCTRDRRRLQLALRGGGDVRLRLRRDRRNRAADAGPYIHRRRGGATSAGHTWVGRLRAQIVESRAR